jgi:DHA2 family multidrug resistance protein-like MFS transporter
VNDPASHASGDLAGRREWIGLGVLALPALLITLDFSVLTLAVPKVSEALHPSASQLLWIVDIYGFLLAGFLIAMGSLGDRIGRRRLLLLGAGGFGAASVLAAFSTSPSMLIGARALLGVAGATLLPSTMALISVMFPNERQRVSAIAIWSASLPVGGAIGPLVGGLMLHWFWWGGAFLIGVPVMVVLLVLGPLVLPEYRDPQAKSPDPLSVVLSLAAVLPIVYGIQALATGGSAAVTWLAVTLGVCFGVAFVLRQRHLSDPLVELRLLRRPALSMALIANLFAYFVILGMLMLFAQYLQLIHGLSTLEAGAWTLPAMAGLILGSLATPLLVERAPPPLVMSAGFLVAALGFFLIGRASAHSGFALAIVGAALFCLGLAPVTTLVVNVVLATAPPERSGAASGLSESTTELGGALGIAVLGTIAAAVYRFRLSDRALRTLPAAARRTARGSLGGAMSAAQHVGWRTGHQLIVQAQGAFAAGVRAAAVVSTAIVLVLAVVCSVSLRRVREPAESGAHAAMPLTSVGASEAHV